MVQLYLSPELGRSIYTMAIQAIPNEICGVLLGLGNEVIEIVPLENTSPTPTNTFRLEEKGLVKTFYDGKRKGLDIIGFYHSHPNTDPIPSQTDVKQANYPDAAHLIVGALRGKPKLAAWSIQYGQVRPIEIIQVSKGTSEEFDVVLTNTQKIAIVVAALLAALFLIIISLSLLPPAPIIKLINP
ncbi:MAG: M67 family metallopeptidase [Anaerolineae bacterium]